jgi:hypothetical protein
MSLESIPFCDEFHPTLEEFKNFEKYVEKCQNETKSGIFKVGTVIILFFKYSF